MIVGRLVHLNTHWRKHPTILSIKNPLVSAEEMHTSGAQVWTYIMYLQCCLRNDDVFSRSDTVQLSLDGAHAEEVLWRSMKLSQVHSESFKVVWWSHHWAENHTRALSWHLHCRQPLQTSYFIQSVEKMGFLRAPITAPLLPRELLTNMKLSFFSSCHWESPQGMARGIKSAP